MPPQTEQKTSPPYLWQASLYLKKAASSATAACAGTLLFWSVGPIFIKYLTGYIDSWSQNMLRYLSACLFWLPFLLVSACRKRLDQRVWRKALVPAGANIVMQSLWAAAFYYIGPGFMVLLSKSSVIWIAAFSFIFFADERKLLGSWRFWLGLGLSVAGLMGVVVCGQDFALPQQATGVAIGLATAFMWGLYTVSVKAAFRDIPSHSGFSVISIYTVAGLCVLGLVFGRPAECLKMPAWPWVCVVISGLLAIALGHVLYYAAVKRIGATVPSLMLLSTPFAVLAISRVVFDESLSALQWLFGCVLLAGSALTIPDIIGTAPEPPSGQIVPRRAAYHKPPR